MSKLLATAFVLLWLLTLVLVMTWDPTVFSILASALGLAAALMVIFGRGGWRPVGALGSLVFVGNWARALVLMNTGGTPLETYASVLRSAAQSGAGLDAAVVIGYEAVLPLLHLITCVALIAGMLKKRSNM